MKNSLSLALCLFFIACGQTPSHRQSEQEKSETNSQAGQKDMAPAIGRFEGKMLMYATNVRYDAVIDTTVIYQVMPSPIDPSQTISVPKLNGNITFPILKGYGSSYPKYKELLIPMAFYTTVSFTSGDFDPSTHNLNLPYTVKDLPNSTYGELQGTLVNDTYTGTWMTRVDGVVGEFVLVKVNSPADIK